jgi:A/G-specific adenine glycosylase
MITRAFRKIVWEYYTAHGRHELPWRLNLDPYAIVVSEVMLQQTQVERGIPKFAAWLQEFPDWAALVEAPLPKVLQQWQGLGYNRRALNLQRCAETVVKEYGGELPRDEASLLDLPGIGPYTAGAIRAFAFNEPVVMIETNIRGVFLHHFWPSNNNSEKRAIRRSLGEGGLGIDDKELLPLIEKTLDRKNPREWYWALMDYGAYLKKTVDNPVRRSRQYVRQSRFVGSNRQVRGAIVRLLITAPLLTEQSLTAALHKEGIAAARIVPALKELEREGFVSINKSKQVQVKSSKFKRL